MSEPTAMQRLAWEAATRLGNQSAAARELGISQPLVNRLVREYREAMGMDDELTPRGKPGGNGEVAERMRIHERLVATEERLHRIEAKIDELLSRPATTQVVQWRPDHRRIADGGRQVRKQRREIRERVAS